MKILVCILLLFSQVLAQSKVETLTEKLKTAKGKERVDILGQLCWELRGREPKKAEEYGVSALKLADEIKYDRSIAQISNYLGVVYRNLGDYGQALFLYRRALSFAQKNSDSVQIAYSYNNIGGIYRTEGAYPLALENMLNALKVFESLNDKSGIAFCAINIGIVYRHEKNYEQALKYLNYSLKLRREINFKQGIALALNQIALVNLDQKNYQEALKIYSSIMPLYKEEKDTKGIAAVYGGLGKIYYLMGNNDRAIESLTNSLELNKKISDKDEQINNYLDLGSVYTAKKEFPKAELYLNTALNISEEINSNNAQNKVLLALSRLYEIKGDFQKALEYHKKYSAIKDTLFSSESIQKIGNIQKEYEVEKREMQNNALKKDVDIQSSIRNYLTAIVIIILLFTFLLYKRYKAIKDLSAKLEEANLAKNRFFRIVAHDLRNPLSNSLNYSELLLSEYFEFSSEEKFDMIKSIDESLKKNVALLNNVLDWASSQADTLKFNPEMLNLHELVDDVQALFVQIANHKKIIIKNNIPVDAECFADDFMIKTVFRNLLTNSIKFTNEEGIIEINSSTVKNKLQIDIKDTGIGMAEDDLEKLFRLDMKHSTLGTQREQGSGLGLVICKEFVEKNNGEIFVSSKKGQGTIFSFTLPFEKV